jgi:hypothetical protein
LINWDFNGQDYIDPETKRFRLEINLEVALLNLSQQQQARVSCAPSSLGSEI